MSILTLSRDRTLQICRSLTFPELDLAHEDILDLYLSLPDSKNTPFFEHSMNSKNTPYSEHLSNSKNPVYSEHSMNSKNTPYSEQSMNSKNTPFLDQPLNSKNPAYSEQSQDSPSNPCVSSSSSFSSSSSSSSSSSCVSSLTPFLLCEMPRQTLLELLKELRELQIRPSREQSTRLKHMRNCLRPPEITLWFALQLVLRVVEGQWRKRKRSQQAKNGDANGDEHELTKRDVETGNQKEFDVLLARSLLWAGAAPLNELLPDDVHFLVKKRNDKREAVRRLCSQCSTKGAGGNKRSSFFCPRCEKCFCRSGKCFEEYHRQHYYRNYPFLT